ncbi:MAG TPA: carboxypeptidase-like regulatory domain-containing protein [Puia sp.]|nr:carboxypeptidase-like regulatory domain-containing protein [Puia sp.]
MGTLKKWSFLLLVLPFALSAKAGTGKKDGVLNGYVTDAITKKPLPGVVVSATVPGSTSATEVLTDADGYFRFSQLPGSQVNVSFDKRGYQSYKRPNVTVGEKSTMKLNVEFQPQEIDPAESDNTEFPILRLLQAS